MKLWSKKEIAAQFKLIRPNGYVDYKTLREKILWPILKNHMTYEDYKKSRVFDYHISRVLASELDLEDQG